MSNLETLLDTLNASQTALTRDFHRDHGDVGDYAIRGKYGHVYPDGAGYLLCVHTQETDKGGHVTYSPRRWTNIKARLSFCRLQQDGDDEGCLHLDHLPTQDEAGAIREALGIRRRRKVTPKARAQLEVARRLLKRPLAA